MGGREGSPRLLQQAHQPVSLTIAPELEGLPRSSLGLGDHWRPLVLRFWELRRGSEPGRSQGERRGGQRRWADGPTVLLETREHVLISFQMRRKKSTILVKENVLMSINIFIFMPTAVVTFIFYHWFSREQEAHGPQEPQRRPRSGLEFWNYLEWEVRGVRWAQREPRACTTSPAQGLAVETHASQGRLLS